MKCKINILLLFLLLTSTVFGQNRISGTVISADDKLGLPGVTVLVKGSKTTAFTDFDGKFSIKAPANCSLVFSFMGYATKEVIVNNAVTVDVKLQPEVSQLKEVVVVGYGTQKKSDVTGSSATVKLSDLANIPAARVDEALQGQVAGVQINQNDASPNSNLTIRIRGVNSINGGSDPLVVVDGTQGLRLSDISPEDIKTMEVLKDASATAIYGSQGAGGVILITTKRGSATKPTFTINTYSSFQQVRKKLDLMNGPQYANYINQSRVAREKPLVFSPSQIKALEASGGTDWQDEIFRPGFTQNIHMNFSGGNEFANYNISGDYLDSQGIVVGSKYTKYAVRTNIGMNFNENTKLTFNSFANFSKDNPTMLDARDSQGSPVYAALVFSPTRPVYNPDGTYSQPGGGFGPNTEYNPLALAKEPIRDNYANTIIFNPSLEFKILKHLKAQVDVSYQLSDYEDNLYYNEKVINGNELDRQGSILDSKWTKFQNTNVLTYQRVFAEKHDLKFTGVYEVQSGKFSNNYVSAKGFLTNDLGYHALQLGTQTNKPYSYASRQDMESLMGRLNYAYDSRYSLTLTLRADGSSVFAVNNKWGYFPSAGLAWNVSNEKFLVNSEVINNLKLRASYGAVGNQAILPYQSLNQLVTGVGVSYDGGPITSGVSLSTQAGNDNLKWETTKQLNLGFDLGLFKNRLTLTADYYKKNTTDLILEKQLKQASGFQKQLVNAGEVENKGFELALSGSPIKAGSFDWNSSFNLSKNNNKVVALNDGVKEILLGGADTPGFTDVVWVEVGQPIGLVRGYEYAGVWKSNEEALAAKYGVKPGSPKYVDQNNDGLINNKDIVNIAKTLPVYTFGWNNTFTYANLSLNVFIQGVQGNKMLNIGKYLTQTEDGLSKDLLHRWTPENEDTNIPGYVSQGDQRNSSQWVEDGSYIRVKNITLAYNIDKEYAKKLGISMAKIYFTASNLFTFTKYSGFDPEANNTSIARSANISSFSGIDLASYPSQKKFTLGFDIKF